MKDEETFVSYSGLCVPLSGLVVLFELSLSDTRALRHLRLYEVEMVGARDGEGLGGNRPQSLGVRQLPQAPKDWEDQDTLGMRRSGNFTRRESERTSSRLKLQPMTCLK